MTAREFFCSARDAVLRLKGYESRLEQSRQEAEMKARREGPSSHGAVSDPTARIDRYIELKLELDRRAPEDRALVERAMLIAVGYSRVDRSGARVVMMRYLLALPWREICGLMGAGYDELRSMESIAFDRMDSEGLSAIESGALRVTGAEG